MKAKCDCGPQLCAKWHPKIEAALRKSAASASRRKQDYVADMSALAKAIGVSRPTLYRHAPYIEHLLRRLEVERRRVDGDAARATLEERIQGVEVQRDAAKQEAAVLRQTLAEVFQTLALNSKPLAALVEATMRERGIQSGNCPLCGGGGAHIQPAATNVIQLPGRDT